MKECDDNKQCQQPLKHDEEALALLAFIKIGEKGIAEHAQTFEDVKVFVADI
ncbi:hypothetical protein L9G15_01085 [Shewanella sp. A3A]|nr:hypothetical protein [Shewanella ferrihydritica]